MNDERYDRLASATDELACVVHEVLNTPGQLDEPWRARLLAANARVYGIRATDARRAAHA